MIPRNALKEELLTNWDTAGMVGTLNCNKPGSNTGECAPTMPIEIDVVQMPCDGAPVDTDTCVGRLTYDTVF